MDLNDLKQKGLAYFNKSKDFAVDTAEKSKVEALVMAKKTKLYRAQRQLGALVYSLAKGHEENQPLVDKYIAAIARIEREIETLQASITTQEAPTASAAQPAPAAQDKSVTDVVDAVVTEPEILQEEVTQVAETAPQVAEAPEVVMVEVVLDETPEKPMEK